MRKHSGLTCCFVVRVGWIGIHLLHRCHNCIQRMRINLHATKHWINLNLLAFTQRNTPAGQVLRRMWCGRSGAAEKVPRRHGGHRRPTPLTAAGTFAYSKAPPEMPQPVPRAASFCWCRRTPRHFPGSRAAAHGAPRTAPGQPPSRRRPWGGRGEPEPKQRTAPGDLGPPRGYCRGLTSCRGMWVKVARPAESAGTAQML